MGESAKGDVVSRPLLVELQDEAALDAALTGGKAANLA